jgi:hypothetical protein
LRPELEALAVPVLEGWASALLTPAELETTVALELAWAIEEEVFEGSTASTTAMTEEEVAATEVDDVADVLILPLKAEDVAAADDSEAVLDEDAEMATVLDEAEDTDVADAPEGPVGKPSIHERTAMSV